MAPKVVRYFVVFIQRGKYLPISASPMWSKFELMMRCDKSICLAVIDFGIDCMLMYPKRM